MADNITLPATGTGTTTPNCATQDIGGVHFQKMVGAAAHDVAVSGNPLLTGLEGRSSDQTVVTSGRVTRALSTLLGKIVAYLYALPAATWQYAAPAGGLVTTSDVQAQAAAGAGVRHYVTAVQVLNTHQTINTEVVIKDGSTVIWRGWAQAGGGGCSARFPTPLRGTAATALNIAEITATATTGVLVNLQGFDAAE